MKNEKLEYRKQVRAALSQCSTDELRTSDSEISSRFLSLPELADCGRIYAYVPYGREISTLQILSAFRKQSKYVYVCWDWPPDVLPGNRDIIIVPALTFDIEGYRIGKGGGYYDRLLEKSPDAFSVGLARDILLAEAVPREPHDMRVSAVVTETRIIRFHQTKFTA